jgi:hypothetical protein
VAGPGGDVVVLDAALADAEALRTILEDAAAGAEAGARTRDCTSLSGTTQR